MFFILSELHVEHWSQIMWNWNHLRTWGDKHWIFFLHTTRSNLFSLHTVSCSFWTGYRKEYTWTEAKVIWTEGQESWKDQWCCCPSPCVILSVPGHTSACIGSRAIFLKFVNATQLKQNYIGFPCFTQMTVVIPLDPVVPILLVLWNR